MTDLSSVTDHMLDELDALVALAEQREPERPGVILPAIRVTSLTAMIRKLQEETQRHAHARAAAEDELERTKAKLEADLTAMTTARHEAREQTGKYAALAAHDDAQARATLERHGMPELHFGCDTLDRVCEELVAARQERDAYKKAKAENDQRFMIERDEARAELAKLDATPMSSVAEARRALGYVISQRDAAKRHGEECSRALEQAHDASRVLLVECATLRGKVATIPNLQTPQPAGRGRAPTPRATHRHVQPSRDAHER